VTEDEVVAGLRASHAPQETDEDREKAAVEWMNAGLAERGMMLTVTIVKVPVQVAPGQFVFADRPTMEVKTRRVEIARPDMSNAINQAVKNTALKLVH
jgi:hypothetical protein